MPSLEISSNSGLTLTSSSIITAPLQPISTAIISPTATLSQTPALSPLTETPLPSSTYIIPNGFDCNNSAYVKDVTIPDGTIVVPGKKFKKTWNLRNTGTCPWTSEYSLTFVSGYSLDGETTTINKYVAPGKTANITILLTAPDAEGTFAGYWLLSDKNGAGFGELINVQVVVSH